MLLGPVFSKHTNSLEGVKALIKETGYFPVVSEDGAVYVSVFDPKATDFYTVNLTDSARLMASKDGTNYRLTVAGIHFLANAMKNADYSI